MKVLTYQSRLLDVLLRHHVFLLLWLRVFGFFVVLFLCKVVHSAGLAIDLIKVTAAAHFAQDHETRHAICFWVGLLVEIRISLNLTLQHLN